MVGVAGRSKGCLTCKKRKIRCDLAKPKCLNCIKAKRECSYDKPLVFISRGPHGSIHRSSRSDSTDAASPPRSSAYRGGGGGGGGATAQDPIPHNPASLQIANSVAYDSYLFAAFMAVWGGPHPMGPDHTGSWLERVNDMTGSRQDSITVSLRALCLTRIAKTWGDEFLVAQGRLVYGRALQLLQAELLNEKTKFSDEVMASCRILSVYEFLESNVDGIAGWITHLQGMEKVVFLRGPQRFRNSLRSGSLVGWRANVMIRSLMQRKANFLSAPKWHADSSSLDRPAERLHDLGLVLGALLERADHFIEARPREFDAYAAVGLTKRLCALDASLDAWFSDWCKEEPNPLWVVPDFVRVGYLESGIYSFPNIRGGILMNTWWTVRLILSDTAGHMCTRLKQAREDDPTARTDFLPAFVESIEQRHHRGYRKGLAVNIVKGTPYCLGQSVDSPDASGTGTGLNIGQRIVFTLAHAMRVLWRFELGVEYARGALLFACLMPKFSFVRDLYKRFKDIAGSAVPDPVELLQKLPPVLHKETPENISPNPRAELVGFRGLFDGATVPEIRAKQRQQDQQEMRQREQEQQREEEGEEEEDFDDYDRGSSKYQVVENTM